MLPAERTLLRRPARVHGHAHARVRVHLTFSHTRTRMRMHTGTTRGAEHGARHHRLPPKLSKNQLLIRFETSLFKIN